MRIKRLAIVCFLLCLGGAASAQQKENKLFSYPYTVDDLPNGLRLITVPTDYPNMVALHI
ncbi:MAG: hypothetical protein HY646_06230, partial [Acidobacteria bacterium]|nr:hypothetical protein [Acidobacteriota bacterium]